MSKLFIKANVALLVCFTLVAAFTTSALAADGQRATANQTVKVFGDFRLVKNGRETKLGTGFFGNPALLRLYRVDDQEELTIKVGDNGFFSKDLAPGDYYVMSIAFKHQGETVEPDTNYLVRIPAGYAASYMGTITLEAEFTGGYMGSRGEFKSFLVTNDCRAECDSHLAQLGLQDASVTTSLPEWQTRVAYSR